MVERALFGGALRCDLPSTFLDASQLRDVPDNQEVWVDTVSDDSLIVECVEYMAHVQDTDSAEFYLRDLVQLDGSSLAEPVNVTALLPEAHTPHVADRAAAVSVAHSALGGDRHVPLWVAAVRLPCVATDMLVTLHRPGGRGDDSTLRNALATLRVADWTFFGESAPLS